MKCPECGSGDVESFRSIEKIDVYRCNTCGEQFVVESDID